MGAEIGNYATSYSSLKFVLHGFIENSINVNGSVKELQRLQHSFFSPLEKYDPINDPESMGEESVKVITIPYQKDQIEITW